MKTIFLLHLSIIYLFKLPLNGNNLPSECFGVLGENVQIEAI